MSDESAEGDSRSPIVAGVLFVGLALNIDLVITLFTPYNALAFWFPPLSNSFETVHGLLLASSPGFYVAGVAVILLWIWEGQKLHGGDTDVA